MIVFSIILLIVGVLSLLMGIVESDWMMIIGGVFLSGFGVLLIFDKITASDNKKKFELSVEKERENLLLEKDLTNSQWISDTKSTICIIDEREEVIWFCYLDENLKYTISRNYAYEDILETEVLIDGETITKTSRGSQLGGALLGGVLAGGVGALIGGLSGSTTSQAEVSSIQLKITVNDINNPVILLKLFNSSIPCDKNDNSVLFCNEEAMEWQGIFAVIINNGDKKVEVKTENNQSDEIRKLHDLLIDGILTQEEFSNQKQKLLMR